MPTLREWWQAASPYLDQALEMPEGDRESWLASLEERDRALAAVVRTLIEEHRVLAEEHFLEESPGLAPGQMASPGQPVGAYTLVSPIGQGGMGSVWSAERNDARFERRAAIKFLNSALAYSGGQERFKREGRILGRLSHPHIAELLDAGVLPNGQPYLVLEYVEGEPVDVYCDRRKLDVEARLRLFLDLLGAIAYAHANLIVHRDIKPSNVLVRADGQLKLLDFGIAKLLEDESARPATLLTREGAGPLTPEYAAPEQVTGGMVTTATDIYALGVLLYVLLTGRHPAGSGRLSAADLIKAIVETDAMRPSEVVKAPDKLRRALQGDLDIIVAKTLKKDPRERYLSVTALADDLGRYLRHEPISTRRDSLAYRIAKYVRRHRTAVSLAMLAFAASLAGVVGTMTQARTANHERAIAQRRFNEVRQLANKLFDIDEQVSQLAGSTKARQLIVDTSLQYLRGLSTDVTGDPALALELGHAYLLVARVQGVSTGRNLGQVDQADQSLRIAEKLIAPVLQVQPANRTALLRAAQTAHDRMILAGLRRGRRDRAGRVEALTFARQSAEWLDKFNAAASDKPEDTEEVLSLYMNVADEYMLGKQFDGALRVCRRATDLARSLGHRTALGMFQWVSAEVLQQRGDLDEALKAIRESVNISGHGRAKDGCPANHESGARAYLGRPDSRSGQRPQFGTMGRRSSVVRPRLPDYRRRGPPGSVRSEQQGSPGDRRNRIGGRSAPLGRRARAGGL